MKVFTLLPKEKMTPSKTFLRNTFTILCYYYSSVFVFGVLGQNYLKIVMKIKVRFTDHYSPYPEQKYLLKIVKV